MIPAFPALPTEPPEPDSVQVLLHLMVRPDLTTEQRRALSEAVAALRLTKATTKAGRFSPPFIKHG